MDGMATNIVQKIKRTVVLICTLDGDSNPQNLVMDRKPFGECRGEVATKRYFFLSRRVARPWCINGFQDFPGYGGAG